MEDNRKEGLDNRIYVPNKYILEINFENDEEREYLLAFLDKDELDNALTKYMAQNKYSLRGPLDFTIEEVSSTDESEKHDKFAVKCKWDVKPIEHAPDVQENVNLVIPALAEYEDKTDVFDDEEYTVASTDIYDASTVSPPGLTIKKAGGGSSFFVISKPNVIIGRSHRLNNDIVIEDDGMISKRHAKISMTADGFRITDIDSTNGVWVNGERVTDAVLKSGDVIRLGSTEIIFDEAGSSKTVASVAKEQVKSSPKLISGDNVKNEEYLLASDMVIGRSLGSDIRVDHSSVSRRHARIFRDGSDYYIEDLGSANGTLVNDSDVHQNSPVRLRTGDHIRVGEVEFSFEMG
jgi:pSer/pThr/pTyr-binding forkhead associated (FHA) protein